MYSYKGKNMDFEIRKILFILNNKWHDLQKIESSFEQFLNYDGFESNKDILYMLSRGSSSVLLEKLINIAANPKDCFRKTQY